MYNRIQSQAMNKSQIKQFLANNKNLFISHSSFQYFKVIIVVLIAIVFLKPAYDLWLSLDSKKTSLTSESMGIFFGIAFATHLVSRIWNHRELLYIGSETGLYIYRSNLLHFFPWPSFTSIELSKNANLITLNLSPTLCNPSLKWAKTIEIELKKDTEIIHRLVRDYIHSTPPVPSTKHQDLIVTKKLDNSQTILPLVICGCILVYLLHGVISQLPGPITLDQSMGLLIASIGFGYNLFYLFKKETFTLFTCNEEGITLVFSPRSSNQTIVIPWNDVEDVYLESIQILDGSPTTVFSFVLSDLSKYESRIFALFKPRRFLCRINRTERRLYIIYGSINPDPQYVIQKCLGHINQKTSLVA
jgi:hypothetical protein